MDEERTRKPIVAVCGKGGVGKTVVTTLLARAARDEGVSPLLLIDADPVGGLTSALGERAIKTLGAVRAELIGTARHGDDEAKRRLAEKLDYMVFEALTEREHYALLSMGRNVEKGCYCPVNSLLRDAIDLVVSPFSLTIIDAEAGVEQINRQVTRHVSHAVVVTDGSQRSHETLGLIAELLGAERVWAVSNRSAEPPVGIRLAGKIPEDETLRAFDREGRALWQLPAENAALSAARAIARNIGLTRLSAPSKG